MRRTHPTALAFVALAACAPSAEAEMYGTVDASSFAVGDYWVTNLDDGGGPPCFGPLDIEPLHLAHAGSANGAQAGLTGRLEYYGNALPLPAVGYSDAAAWTDAGGDTVVLSLPSDQGHRFRVDVALAAYDDQPTCKTHFIALHDDLAGQLARHDIDHLEDRPDVPGDKF